MASARIRALRTAARASSSRPGRRDRLRKLAAGSPAISRVQRHGRFRLLPATSRRPTGGRGRPAPRRSGSPAPPAPPARRGIPAACRPSRTSPGRPPAPWTRSRPRPRCTAGRSPGREVPAPCRRACPRDGRRGSVEIADRRAVVAVLHDLDGPVVPLVGHGPGDDRAQSEAQQHQQPEREHEPQHQRRGDDSLASRHGGAAHRGASCHHSRIRANRDGDLAGLLCRSAGPSPVAVGDARARRPRRPSLSISSSASQSSRSSGDGAALARVPGGSGPVRS